MTPKEKTEAALIAAAEIGLAAAGWWLFNAYRRIRRELLLCQLQIHELRNTDPLLWTSPEGTPPSRSSVTLPPGLKLQ